MEKQIKNFGVAGFFLPGINATVFSLGINTDFVFYKMERFKNLNKIQLIFNIPHGPNRFLPTFAL